MIMIQTPLTIKALNLAYEKHHNQQDKSGVPYIFHPYHLAEQMVDEETVIVALLHDVLEDTTTTIEELRSYGFNESCIEAIVLLTHDKSTPYLNYINKIKENELARTVKIADIKHNMDITRLKKIEEKDLIRLDQYKKALKILE